MAEEELSLQKVFRYLEWISIIAMIIQQFFWVCNVYQFNWLIGLSFFFLVLELPLSAIMPQSTRWRFAHLLAQIVFISLAACLGMHRRSFVYFLILGAKAAALLPGRQMICVAALLLVTRTYSALVSQDLVSHLYVRRAFVPQLYSSLIPETEAKIYFVIGLITVLYLGRTLIAERRSRTMQQSLAKKAEQLSIEFERNKIATDIHDRLGHTLASQVIQLELAIKLVEDNKLDIAKDLVAQSYDSSVSCLQELRQAVKEMRSDDG